MNYRILANKPVIAFRSDFDGTDITPAYDLLAESYDKNVVDGYNGTPVLINEYYVARPDLISLAIYGTDEYADIICKYNGISNPFELNENMFVICPDLNGLHQALVNYIPEVGNEFIDSKDDTIQVKHNTNKKYVNETRSPNEQTINDKNFIIDRTNNLIFY